MTGYDQQADAPDRPRARLAGTPRTVQLRYAVELTWLLLWWRPGQPAWRGWALRIGWSLFISVVAISIAMDVLGWLLVLVGGRGPWMMAVLVGGTVLAGCATGRFFALLPDRPPADLARDLSPGMKAGAPTTGRPSRWRPKRQPT